MRIFIGGVMQASITGKGIVSQDYRRRIAEAFRRIQKMSMNTRKPMKDVAEAIILAHQTQQQSLV